MNIFSVPKENVLTLCRSHFKASRLLKDKDNNIACAHPKNTDKKSNHVNVLEGNSRSVNVKKTKAIIKNLDKF